MEGVSGLQRKLLALALLVLAVALVASVTVLPLVGERQQAADVIASLEERLDRLRKRGEMRQELERRYAAVRQGYDADARLLKADSESLAAAELQGIVKRAVEQHGGSIVSSQVLPVQRLEGAGRLPLKVTVRVGLEGLVGALYGLEAGTPYLFVDGVSIRAARTPRRGGSGPAPEAADLSVEMQVSGYFRMPTS